MKYKNIVISGGGLNGFYFLGSLKYLFKYDKINLQRILGVSIGAVLSYLLVIGYDIDFLIKLFIKININKLIPEINIDTFLDEYYFLDNIKFDKLLIFLTKKKGIDPNINLLELYQQKNIELIIGTANLSKYRYEYISYLSHPTLSALIALKMSYSIPLLFKPIIYNNMYYVDGALINYFPIKYFNKDIKNTLGITLFPKYEEINNLLSYLKHMIKPFATSKYIYNYPNNTILINTNDTFSIFDLINTDRIDNLKKNMIIIGYNETKKFFNNKYNFIKNIILDIINNIK
jgi:NTE family protein